MYRNEKNIGWGEDSRGVNNKKVDGDDGNLEDIHS